MNLRLGSRHFAALLTPGGIHLIEYRRGARRLQIVRYVQDLQPLPGGADAVTRLADLLEANGAAGGRVAVAVGGFGSYYHVLSLPPAPSAVLTPVVMRELRHIYPDLKESAVGFRRTALSLDAGSKKKPEPGEREHQLLVGMVPRDLLGLMHETLSSRGMTLEHVTILPRAVQRIHQAFVGSDEPLALVLLLPGAPLVGFFNQEALHFFSSPPPVDPDNASDLLPLLEQLERGALFIRQQFRGMRLERLILSTGTVAPVVRQALTEQGLTERIESLSPEGVPPGALAALGVALDAREESGLNLLPPALQPTAEADPWILEIALVGALLLILASGWWGWRAARSAELTEQRVEVATSELQQRLAPLEAVRPVVEARRAHAERVALLTPLEVSRGRLQELLWSMEIAPPEIRLDSLRLMQGDGSWQGVVAGAAYSPSRAQASRAIDQWHRDLAARFPPGAVTVDHLASERQDSTGTAQPHLSFRLVVQVPATEGTP